MEGDLENRIKNLANVIRRIQVASVPTSNELDMGEVNYSHLYKITDSE